MSGIIGTSNSRSKVIGKSHDTAKAWVNFNATGTQAIRSSFNVSSITDTGTGRTRITFDKGMKDTNYLALITARHSSHNNNGVSDANYSQLAASFEFQIGYVSGTGGQAVQTDVTHVMVGIFGD